MFLYEKLILNAEYYCRKYNRLYAKNNHFSLLHNSNINKFILYTTLNRLYNIGPINNPKKDRYQNKHVFGHKKYCNGDMSKRIWSA